MDVKSRNGAKFEIFFELFSPPCRNALADLDGYIPECAEISALHIELHLATLRKIEMVAVLCTNETPIFVFNSPSPGGGELKTKTVACVWTHRSRSRGSTV